jgi:Spy/CpxP family protein refolding chaperone
LILSNQQALGLTDEQVQSIKTTLKQAHDQTLDSQVALQRAVETLHGALKGNRVDEAAALAAAEQVMTLEGAMKRSHLALMIRIKNQLTPEQQQKLEQMRKPARANQE